MLLRNLGVPFAVALVFLAIANFLIKRLTEPNYRKGFGGWWHKKTNFRKFHGVDDEGHSSIV